MGFCATFHPTRITCLSNVATPRFYSFFICCPTVSHLVQHLVLLSMPFHRSCTILEEDSFGPTRLLFLLVFFGHLCLPHRWFQRNDVYPCREYFSDTSHGVLRPARWILPSSGTMKKRRSLLSLFISGTTTRIQSSIKSMIAATAFDTENRQGNTHDANDPPM